MSSVCMCARGVCVVIFEYQMYSQGNWERDRGGEQGKCTEFVLYKHHPFVVWKDVVIK